MILNVIENTISFLKITAPISITINIVVGIALFVLGIILLINSSVHNRRRRIGGWVCISISILGFVGSISTYFVSHLI